MIMSLLNEVQKFIEAHPGCTSGDIADAFAGYSRQHVLQSASKLRQSGRVAHRCEGDTRRHFPRLTSPPHNSKLLDLSMHSNFRSSLITDIHYSYGRRYACWVGKV